MKVNSSNYVTYITKYESDDLSDEDIIHLFSYLLSSRLILHLHYNYERTADSLIANGYLSEEGEILSISEN